VHHPKAFERQSHHRVKRKEGLNRVVFRQIRSEAVDTAMKMDDDHRVRGQAQTQVFVSREQTKNESNMGAVALRGTGACFFVVFCNFFFFLLSISGGAFGPGCRSYHMRHTALPMEQTKKRMVNAAGGRRRKLPRTSRRLCQLSACEKYRGGSSNRRRLVGCLPAQGYLDRVRQICRSARHFAGV